MEIKQLEIFTSVARKLSFSKAADELYISQPTVSAQINSLEKSLGAQLLIRNTKGVSLTKTGEEFLSYAKKILSLRDQAKSCTGSKGRGATGAIDIIASTLPAQHLLPEIIASFQKEWPNIIFRVEQSDSGKVVAEMNSFKYDFGMIGTKPDGERGDRFVCHTIFNDELVLVLPKGFAAEDLDNFSQGKLAQLITKTPFLMRESGSGTRTEIGDILDKSGVDIQKLHVPAYFPDAHSILAAVSKGVGISLVSKIAADMYVKAGLVKQIEMTGGLFTRQIYLIYNKELWLSPMQRAFVDYVRGGVQ
ncbi:MAG: selenium metabolism-associated LysR family transcriptional regulator [Oscillospiraceae bacterium]|nr:selenium metabolism-associated LysR family transcriptional regulator [Oscillospiraceae bacterium]